MTAISVNYLFSAWNCEISYNLVGKIIHVNHFVNEKNYSDSGRAPGPTTARADMLEEIPSNLPP